MIQRVTATVAGVEHVSQSFLVGVQVTISEAAVANVAGTERVYQSFRVKAQATTIRSGPEVDREPWTAEAATEKPAMATMSICLHRCVNP